MFSENFCAKIKNLSTFVFMRRASFGTQWVCLLFISLLAGICPTVLAVPAPKKFVQITQPDGSKLTVMKKGDEFFHYAVSRDGYTLNTDSSGFYRYLICNSTGDLVPGPHVATEPDSRNPETLRFLSTLEPGMRFSEQQRAQAIERRIEQATPSIQQAPALRSASANALNNLLINDYPLTGTVRSLVILVSFNDNNFTTLLPNTAFSNFLNQEGYDVGNHIGSVSDYYTSNSNGAFTPEFVVAGPVKLTNNMAYYGANVEGRDVRPREMVREACLAVDATIDFSQFDNNGDGIVDNVYIFYAGKGEADGGGVNSIWPHSYALSGSYSLTLDGKTIYTYGCSAELDGSGDMTGIGVFTHEFGHVIGLPDFYDVDNEVNGEGFDPDAWSLMAYGSYNKDGHVPPCLTVVERYLLGWTEPNLLSVPATPSLSPWASSNQSMIINTNNSKEFFLLENRQQLPGTWDEFIPYHGMLVYHIDARDNVSTSISYQGASKSFTYEELWQYNVVNVIENHQCADIEEADNSRVKYNGFNYASFITSQKGDPYPGYYSITTINDNTLPSMKTWNGAAINKPITHIAEKQIVGQQGSEITFDFMGGKNKMDTPLAREAQSIYPFSFEARWHSVSGAYGYLLDVFTLDIVGEDSTKTFVAGYRNFPVSDTSCVIHVPTEQSSYYYQVRSTNGFKYSEYSDIISLSTTNSKPVIRQAGDIRPFQFKANWAPLPWATGYYLTVFEIDTLPGGSTAESILPSYNNILTPDTSFMVDELDNERTYGYFMTATDGFATGVRSDVITLNTPSATDIIPYIRNGYIYLKGIDPGSTVTLYGLDGLVKQTSNVPTIKVAGKGLYIVELQFKNTSKRIKVLVN